MLQTMTRWRHQKVFKSRKTIKLTCSFQHTCSVWPLLPACQFIINNFRKGAYTDAFTTEWRAEIGAWQCYQWIADVCKEAGILGLNFQSNMSFWNVEKLTVVSHLCRIPEHHTVELTGHVSQLHSLWGNRKEPAHCLLVLWSRTSILLEHFLKLGFLSRKLQKRFWTRKCAFGEWRREGNVPTWVRCFFHFFFH